MKLSVEDSPKKFEMLEGMIWKKDATGERYEEFNGYLNDFAQVDTLTQQSSLTYNHHFNIPSPWVYRTGYRKAQLENDTELTYNYTRGETKPFL